MEQQKLCGLVENIVYKNHDTGFCVLDLNVDNAPVTVVGDLADVQEGEELTVYGSFVTHPNFGSQFRAEIAERVLPRTATAIMKYLSGGAIEGVGPVTAKRLVARFSDSTLEVIARQPEKLSEIKGISKSKAQEISRRFARIYGMRETLAELSSLGLDLTDSISLFRAFADSAAQLVSDNPFLLCGYPLYKEFSFADEIARSRGVEPDDARRVLAGYVFALRHNLDNGHTCLPAEKLVDLVSEYIGAARDVCEIKLYDFIEDGSLRRAVLEEKERIFLGDMYIAEKYISERIRLLAELSFKQPEDIEGKIDEFEQKNGIEYAPLQRSAIEAALCEGVVVITGGPGTGKTTTVNAIIGLCEQEDDRVMLAAPTGRAAKRMSEVTGRQARTIHRLLEMDFAPDGSLRFVHDDNNPLKCDVLVVDEMSMVDSMLFCSLLKGLPPHCRLVLVGDSDQLPAVGAGNVLRDIVASGVCRTVELSHIFRQAAVSLIVTNAHKIVGGELPDLSVRDNDFFFIECAGEDAAELAVSLAGKRLPKKYGLDPFFDVQILTPTRLGAGGTMALNERMREKLNPAGPKKAEVKIMGNLLRAGDKVMQTKNNYDIKYVRDGGEQGVGVFNGDVGVITAVDYQSRSVVVRFDDRTVKYDFDHARQLEPAYAVTVHKSQGSEFEAVVLVLTGVSRKLRYRNLLYTAVTRARRILVIVGERALLEDMVANDKKLLRYTGLRGFLQESGPYEFL